MRHCRCLLATGSSARSVREQLFLNGAFFLREELYNEFREAMPQLRWFNTQREGMGYESVLYSFVEIAKCEEVVQWGFDETSLNGIPTLNQWCRIKVGEAYRTVTIECAGLLTGSTATRVAEHVKILWERGQEAVRMLRQELGVNADELVPLVHGGVTMAKLRGVMHDTCNSANLIAKKVRRIRDTVGQDMYGPEEWAKMQECGKGWQDFLCANHSRNLHFDAFSRLFIAYTKEKMDEGMAAAKLRSGGRLRLEPDGEAFVRSICKLTHVGPKQYAKGASYPYPKPARNPCLTLHLTSYRNAYVGGGIQFRDFCDEHFPDLVNQCVGRAELSKRSLFSFSCNTYLMHNLYTSPKSRRQDCASEACFQIYPLYDAMMLYLIDAMVLEHRYPFFTHTYPNLCVSLVLSCLVLDCLGLSWPTSCLCRVRTVVYDTDSTTV